MEHTQHHQECIQNCLNCLKICTECVIHCLEKGGKHSEKSHINLMLSCALLCETHAKLMMRNCGFSSKVAAICAQACRDCAEDCLKIDETDEMMKKCAEICKVCSESCEREAQEHH